MEDVDHHLQIIEHDPLAGRETVNRDRANGVIFAQSRFDFICDRFELRLGGGRANDEEIGESRDRAQIPRPYAARPDAQLVSN